MQLQRDTAVESPTEPEVYYVCAYIDGLDTDQAWDFIQSYAAIYLPRKPPGLYYGDPELVT